MVAAWWLLGGWLVGWLAAWLVGWCNRSYTSCWKSSGPNKNNKSYSWSLGLIHAFLPLGKPFGRLGLPAVLLHSHLSGLQSWKLEDTFSGRGGSVKLHIGEWMYIFSLLLWWKNRINQMKLTQMEERNMKLWLSSLETRLSPMYIATNPQTSLQQKELKH